MVTSRKISDFLDCYGNFWKNFRLSGFLWYLLEKFQYFWILMVTSGKTASKLTSGGKLGSSMYDMSEHIQPFKPIADNSKLW